MLKTLKTIHTRMQDLLQGGVLTLPIISLDFLVSVRKENHDYLP
jgi:hypothetical protein